MAHLGQVFNDEKTNREDTEKPQEAQEILLDSGASTSFISHDRFIAINNPFLYSREHFFTNIQLGKGYLEKQEALRAIIPTTIMAEDRERYTFQKNYVVLKCLEDCIFLGSDFFFESSF